MKYGKLIIFVVLLGIFINIGSLASAEEAAQTAPKADPTPASVKEIAIYGEVKAVSVADKVMTVQYYDYDSDEEKSVDVVIGSDTKIENVASLGEIKQGDWLDVTYINQDGKNLAKIVTVEKDEIEDAPQAEKTEEVKE